jgi:hypothetical protein
VVLKLLRHLLCLGLLLGLAGNGIAIAAPCILMTQDQAAAMADMPDCAMGQADQQNQRHEKGKAPGCMATVACPAMLAMKEPSASTSPYTRAAAVYFWPTSTELRGRKVAPEPEPPTILG